MKAKLEFSQNPEDQKWFRRAIVANKLYNALVDIKDGKDFKETMEEYSIDLKALE